MGGTILLPFKRYVTMVVHGISFDVIQVTKIICDSRVSWTIYKQEVSHCMQVCWSSGLKCCFYYLIIILFIVVINWISFGGN